MEIRYNHIFSKTTKVEIYHGSNMIFQDLPKPPTGMVDINNLAINVDAEGEHLGWVISVTVQFTGTSSVLFVSSITMEFQ
jgi:hypothetical protein